jgi:tRNA threonylcarbamoyladenosine biosynthesis protein TsaB
MVICIETATNLCSVALCSSSGVIFLKENTDLKSHASMLTVFIDEALKEKGIKDQDHTLV